MDAIRSNGELDVHARPFKEGSFTTEFVFTYSQPIVDMFSDPSVNSLASAIAILGFMCDVAATLPKVIRRARGRIDRFSVNDDSTFTYGKGADSISANEDTHKIIQSPNVAQPFKSATIGPLVNTSRGMAVNVMSREEYNNGEYGEGDTFGCVAMENVGTYEAAAESEALLEDEEIESRLLMMLFLRLFRVV